MCHGNTRIFENHAPEISAGDLRRFAHATGWELIDEDGTEFGNNVTTAETIDDFISSAAIHWNECGTHYRVLIPSWLASADDGNDGFPAIYWPRMQMRKGDPRGPLSVVDFGDHRLAMKDTDLHGFCFPTEKG